MSSMPRCEAASISITSSDVPFAIVTQALQVLSGVGVGPCAQFSDLARIRAIDVLPVPRGPANRYACRTWPDATAFLSVRTTPSWPTTSSKSCGRYFLYSAVMRPSLEDRERPVRAPHHRTAAPPDMRRGRPATSVLQAHSAASRHVPAEPARTCGGEAPGHALRRRNGPPGRNSRRSLGPGGAAAPERESLALLPSGSDAVRTLPVRGTWPSSLRARAQAPRVPPLGRRSAPPSADCGFKEPLAPRLARPGAADRSTGRLP